MIKLLHLPPFFRSMGGVEAVVRHHHAQDQSQQIQSRFVVFFEAEEQPIERVRFLGFGPATRLRQARRALCDAVGPNPPDVAVYHGLWGISSLADLDLAERRLVVLHGDFPGFRRALLARAEWVDGLLCVNEPVRQLVLRYLPGLEAERVAVVSCPIWPPGPAPAKPPLAGRPLVLGFSSRLIVEQKRVDRLPSLCAHLDEAGLAYRFEFLGEGPDRPWLEQQFPDRSRFVFHGCKAGPDYWRVLGGWDVVVSLSDYEGTPLSLLEAMSMGAVPIYPRLGSGGDDYATRVRPDLLYQPGNLVEVAKITRNLASLKDEEIQVLRGRCQQAIASHLGDNYLSGFAKHIRKVLALPRISRKKAMSSLWLLERFSFGQLARIRALGQASRRLLGR